MSDLFQAHNEISQDECDSYARQLTNGEVIPVSWQGYHSYTLSSENRKVIQFRSGASPLDHAAVKLAKEVHGDLAPCTEFHGNMPGSSVSIWSMEKLPGVGYLSMAGSGDVARDKLSATVTGLAKFYSASWKHPQPKNESLRNEYSKKLTQLSETLPSRFLPIILQSLQGLEDVLTTLPWVLTHQDLSNMNILVDPGSGDLTGIVDWADADIQPFGVVLWGLESVLGCSGPRGWSWFTHDVPNYRKLFYDTFSAEVGGVSQVQCEMIERARVLGMLLHYGFEWNDGDIVPTSNTALLDVFLAVSNADVEDLGTN